MPISTTKPVSSLFHDPENPRLPSRVKKKSDDEGEVIKWMLQDASLLELMGAIAQVGFFPGEPLLVVKDQDSAVEKYNVVEGNRRLTAVKLILRPELAQIFKETVKEISDSANKKEELINLPVIVYDDRDEIIHYLGYRHITGIKEWGTFEKAQYLNVLAKKEPYCSYSKLECYSALSKVIGSKRDYVARLLCGFELNSIAAEEEFLEEKDINHMQENFSLLTTSLSYNGIANYINIDPKSNEVETLNKEHFEEVISWVFEEQSDGSRIVSESRKLKELNAVVTNDTAVIYLKDNHDLNGAYQIASAESATANFRTQLIKIQSILKTFIGQVDTDKIEGLIQDDLKTLNEIDDLVTRLRSAIKAKI
ncbi:MAG: hypothetical protein COW65_11700 [Cytophagales bacterium CG18_big_fil_WC_8_21_14_2_50_42_9]|nr:MAG: hypothetical protein COW65_11700 [Cytophagales bacterium CG18_big_fil_WC_8_21_14_2_50_42_9]